MCLVVSLILLLCSTLFNVNSASGAMLREVRSAPSASEALPAAGLPRREMPQVPALKDAVDPVKSPPPPGEGCGWDDRGQLVCEVCGNDPTGLIPCYPVFGHMPEYSRDGRCFIEQSPERWEIIVERCSYRWDQAGGLFNKLVLRTFELLMTLNVPHNRAEIFWQLDWLLPLIYPDTVQVYTCAHVSKRFGGPVDHFDFLEEDDAPELVQIGRLSRQVGPFTLRTKKEFPGFHVLVMSYMSPEGLGFELEVDRVYVLTREYPGECF